MSLETRDPDTEQARRWWFTRVNELSDLDLQRRTWLDKKNTNPHWSYVEFIETYPKDDQLGHALTEGWLAPDEFRILRGLGHVLSTHSPPGGDYYDSAAVLEDSAWLGVVAAAERAKQQLLAITADPQERKALMGGG